MPQTEPRAELVIRPARDDRVAVAEMFAKEAFGDHPAPGHVPGLVVGNTDLGHDINLWVTFRPCVQIPNQPVEGKLRAYGCKYLHVRLSGINR